MSNTLWRGAYFIDKIGGRPIESGWYTLFLNEVSVGIGVGKVVQENHLAEITSTKFL